MQVNANERENIVNLYFNDIATSTPLSREREVALAAQIKEGDMQARNELVQANLRFVIDVAKHYQNRGLSLSDLIAAGNLGLLTAADRFDGAKGFKFISYAVWWIRQSILQTLAEHVRTVRLPLNKLSLLKDISEVSRRLGQGCEGDPDLEEIAAELDLPADQIADAMISARPVRSLDEIFEDDDKRSLMNTLVDHLQSSPDADLLHESARGQVDNILSHLSEREQFVIRRYFGLDGDEALTLDRIGSQIGVTRERVRQIKESALSKLRQTSRAQILKALAEDI
jgi:RNA polymerase primary sigma factor